MSPTPHEWITEGAEVAVVTGGGGFRSATVEFVRVERTTPTQAKLVDGRRFQRTGDCYQFAAGTSTKLRRPTDADVVDAYARRLLEAFITGADRISQGSGATLSKMSAETVRDTLDALAGQINAARKELDRRHSRVTR